MPRWIKRKSFEFTASGAGGDSTKERNATQRFPLADRLRNILGTNRLGFHLLYVVVSIICLARTSNRVLQRQHEGTEDFVVDLLTHVAWPPLLWLIWLNSFLIPLQYTLNPPTIPNHAQLLKRDPVRRASYPIEVKQTGQCRWLGSQEFNYMAVVLYTSVLFGFSWNV